MPNKEVELVEQLLDKTRARAIAWEPTARDNEFVSSFKGQATFTVSKYDDPSYYGESFKLIMRDPENREMLIFDSRSGFVALDRCLPALYRAAHDSALKVEETLDAILDNLKNAS
jgi:hypothetical protein